MGSESIAHSTFGLMGYWLIAHLGSRNNIIVKYSFVMCKRNVWEQRKNPVSSALQCTVLWKIVLLRLIFILTTRVSNSCPVTFFFYQGEESRPPLAQTLLGSLAVSIAPDACNAMLHCLCTKNSWHEYPEMHEKRFMPINSKKHLVKCHFCPISTPQNCILN